MKNWLKKNLKRLGLGSATLAVIIAGAAAFSAFEAHIINVTARIENALSVPSDALDFGTVFPQENLVKTVEITMSDSFDAEDDVDDIEYVVKQKPKVKACQEPVGTVPLPCVGTATQNDNPTPGDPYAIIHPTTNPAGIVAWEYCETNLPPNAPYGLTLADLDDEYWAYCYLPLANYLSKHEVTLDPSEEEDNDTSIDAFHHAYLWAGTAEVPTLPSSLNPAFYAEGRLAKSELDEADSWEIDLMVPCFVNHCAQEANDEGNLPDDETPGFFVPDEFRLPALLEHLVFGTDLWFEVTEVSRNGDQNGQEKIGAKLSDYVQTADCDVDVDDSGGQDSTTINGGIGLATPGDTVCVADGIYNENVAISINVDLWGDGATATSTINGNVTMSATADGAELRGFLINGSVSSDAENVTIEFNKVLPLAGGNGIQFGGTGTLGSTISNNVVTTFALTSPNNRGIYLDQNGTNDFMVDHNTVTARKSGFGSESSGTVERNVFNGYDDGPGIGWEVFYGASDTAPVISFNNFNESPGIGAANADSVTFDAPSNWWGDASSAGNISGTMTTSADQASAYPEN